MQQDQLTMGERAVASALARGLSPQAISRELSVNMRFVRATLSSLRLRYGVNSLEELADQLRRIVQAAD